MGHVTDEFGIFNAEGCLERQIWNRDEAMAVLHGPLYAEEPDVYVAALCPDHDEQPATHCEECFEAEEAEL